MSKASKETFLEMVISGQRKTIKAHVLMQFVHRGALSIRHVCNLVDKPWKTTAARISELCDEGYLYVESTEHDGTSTYSKFKLELSEAKRKENAENRRLKRFEAWLRKGQELYPEYLTKESMMGQMKIQ